MESEITPTNKILYCDDISFVLFHEYTDAQNGSLSCIKVNLHYFK